MYPALFEECMDRLMSDRIEGGYVNDPNDPGGETKYGISKRSYPSVDIRNLTKEQAKSIYFRDFWFSWMEMQPEAAYHILSAMVHSGQTTVIRWVQRSLGVADDGQFGPISQAAYKKAQAAPFLFMFIAVRLDFFTRLKNWRHHGKGWSRRISLEMQIAAGDLTRPKIRR